MRINLPNTVIPVIITALYLACAIYVVADDRKSKGGGWITLHGMPTFLVTFPISAPGELLGLRPDFRSNRDMVIAIGGTAGLVYLAASGVMTLFRRLAAG